MHKFLALIPLLAATMPAATPTANVPAGTQMHVRLATKAGSTASKAGDAVEAVVIAPVVVEGRMALPAGSKVSGKVKEARPAPNEKERALLVIEFTELSVPGGGKRTIAAKVAEVDNARETVDADGRILGILESETLSARMDRGLERLSDKWARFGDILQAVKGAVVKKADPEITYEPGVELDLALTKAAEFPEKFDEPRIASIEPVGELERLVNAQPFQTTAEKPPKPSDITNLMYIGSKESVARVFEAAGWATAEQLSAKSGIETVAAVAENRGYKEAPMSVLLLDGKPPDMVFQKQLNTFAERHHLRIFKRPDKFRGRDVWVCAATHDIGISFSPENRTFIHLIDPQIDRERAKVVIDLVFTGLVKGLALVERPAVPKSGMNATGDKIETDGRIAVVMVE